MGRRQRPKGRLAQRVRVVCPSGKVGYTSVAAAVDALEQINRPQGRRQSRTPPTGYYDNCPLCGAVHLTSKRQNRT